MAKLTGGILGKISGKVAGVVAGQWKDKNYVRQYTKPANPNTASQQTQRSKFSNAVTFAKLILGQIINTYIDPFMRSMSGFNYFIKQNIANFGAVPDYDSVKVTFGKLFSPASFEVDGWSSKTVTMIWDESLGSNGALTDKIMACAYNEDSGAMYFASAPVTRDDESIDIDCSAGEVDDNVTIYAWAYTLNGAGTVDSCSDSVNYDSVIA
jgi:hypothetical protein